MFASGKAKFPQGFYSKQNLDLTLDIDAIKLCRTYTGLISVIMNSCLKGLLAISLASSLSHASSDVREKNKAVSCVVLFLKQH